MSRQRRTPALRRALRLVLAATLLVGVEVAELATPRNAEAASRCTAWSSSTVPPESIWVHIPIRRGRRTYKGYAEQVDFKTYVERVVISEWGNKATTRAELLEAALLAKQYAWYYILHPSSSRRDKAKHCFDIGSTTAYQIYRPTATTSAAQLARIRSAIEATWQMGLWRTAGSQQGFAHPGYRTGVYSRGCPYRTNGWHLLHQNARRCAQEGWAFESIVRRYYGQVAFYENRPDRIADVPLGRLWRVSAGRELISSSGSAPWTSHGALLPETPAGSSSLGILAIDALRTSAEPAGYEAVEVGADAAGLPWIARLTPASSARRVVDDPLTTPWSPPSGDWSGWYAAGDDVRPYAGDFDGDLYPEVGLLRLRVEGSGATSATLAAFELGPDGWSWRDDIWSVADLAAAGLDPAQLATTVGDFNGDGADDLALATATTDPALLAGEPTSIWLAASTPVDGPSTVTAAESVLAAPARIGGAAEAPPQVRLGSGDRTYDGRDELFLFAEQGDGTLRVEGLGLPLPWELDVPIAREAIWTSGPSLGSVDLASVQLQDDPAGISVVRVARYGRKPQLNANLLLSARFATGEVVYEIAGRGTPPLVAVAITPGIGAGSIATSAHLHR